MPECLREDCGPGSLAARPKRRALAFARRHVGWVGWRWVALGVGVRSVVALGRALVVWLGPVELHIGRRRKA